MFTRGVARSAAATSRGNASSLFLRLRGSASPLPLGGRRYISVYGYTQSKALIYSKYGEPKDVLRYVTLLPESNRDSLVNT